MTILIALLCIVSSFYCFQSLTACVDANLPKAAWKEIFKIGVNIAVIIYLYTIVL